MKYTKYIVDAVGCDDATADIIEAEMEKAGGIEWMDIGELSSAARKAAEKLGIEIKPKI